MTFPAGATIYTFSGISFVRLREDDMQPWAFGEIVYTKDALLGGSQVYIDVGADVAPLFTFRAEVLTTADRFNLRNARGTTATLSNTRGRSDSMTLIKATPMDGANNQLYIELAFELRPS